MLAFSQSLRGLLLAAVVGLLARLAWGAETLGSNIILNGCFNNPYCGSSFCSAVSGNYIKNWTITSGDVEQLNGFVANIPANCVCGGSIDMNGNSQGTIQQTVATEPGNNYAIYFDYSSNGATKTMDVYWCETLIGSVTSGNQGTWKNYTSVQAATGTTCALKFVSTIGGAGGVVPTNVQVVPIGSATTNTYPQLPSGDGCPTKSPSRAPTILPTRIPTSTPTLIPTKAPTSTPTSGSTSPPTESPTRRPTQAPTRLPTKMPTRSPTPAYYIIQNTGQRCAEAGVLVPDSVWDNYPNINLQRRRRELLSSDSARELTPGVPDAEMCYVYCSNYYNGGVNTYYNLRTLPTKNECYCCGGICTPVPDPEYSYYQIRRPTPQPDPVPPLPDYQKQGDQQRCRQQGTLATPFSPPTQEQCWRICSYANGVAQPNTYFNIKLSATPPECYCVGPVCDVIYDPNYIYDRINNPSTPFPDCPKFAYAWSSQTLKATAGKSAKYSMVLKDKSALIGALNGPNSNAEFMLRLPAGVTPAALKVSPASAVAATPVNDPNIPANTYVWKLAANNKRVTSLRITAMLSINACLPSGMDYQVEGSFWPFGRSVYNCNFGYGDPARLTIKANPAMCDGKKSHKGGVPGPKPSKGKWESMPN